MATYYYSLPGGGVAFREADSEPVVPSGWVKVDAPNYQATLEVIKAADAVSVAHGIANVDNDKRDAYLNLKASRHTDDWSDATIRLITGYDGE